jgi:hypothetical protein
LGFIMWRINVVTFERRVIAFTIQSAGEVIRRSVMSILIRRSSVVLRKSVEYTIPFPFLLSPNLIRTCVQTSNNKREREGAHALTYFYLVDESRNKSTITKI